MAKNRVDPGQSGRGRPNVVKGARTAGSRRPFYLSLIGIAAVGVALIAWASRRAATAVVTIDPKDAAGVTAEGYVMGSASAPVEIIEFADFECPGCGQFATVTEPDVRTRIVQTGLARFRVYDFPVNSSHRNSASASMAAACASDQNKFWEMHDRIFQGQNDWSTYATDDPKEHFERYARELGLDMAAWNQCYDSNKHRGRIAAHAQEASRRRVPSTPTFIIGDKQLVGAQPYDVIKAYVDSARMAVGAAGAQTAAPADTTRR
jgi:protein-disulfide isomerase